MRFLNLNVFKIAVNKNNQLLLLKIYQELFRILSVKAIVL